MELRHLFEGELVYEEATHTAVAPYRDKRWFGYTPARGTLTGRLSGRVRCHNLYSQVEVDPEMFAPHYRGAIETGDEALVLFEADGYNRFEGSIGTVVMRMTFQTSVDPYRWLNETFAVVEARCFAVEGGPQTERWTLRGFECINDLP